MASGNGILFFALGVHTVIWRFGACLEGCLSGHCVRNTRIARECEKSEKKSSDANSLELVIVTLLFALVCEFREHSCISEFIDNFKREFLEDKVTPGRTNRVSDVAKKEFRFREAIVR